MVETTIVFFRFHALKRPVLKVMEAPDQVVIVIRSERDEHLTLHRQKDGTVLLTHWSPDKPRGGWDAIRVKTARALGYRDADRHAHYFQHRPLFAVSGMDGHELLGRCIRLECATSRRKYDRATRVVVDAPAREFMLSFHLATPEQPYSEPDDPHLTTGFGDLYFRASVIGANP